MGRCRRWSLPVDVRRLLVRAVHIRQMGVVRRKDSVASIECNLECPLRWWDSGGLRCCQFPIEWGKWHLGAWRVIGHWNTLRKCSLQPASYHWDSLYGRQWGLHRTIAIV